MRVLTLVLLSIFFLSGGISAQSNTLRKINNKAFKPGEILEFRIHYGLVDAGIARLEVKDKMHLVNNRSSYHVVGIGNTTGAFDWFFKVRDRYETYIDTSTMLPMKFIRNVDEGGYKIYNNVTFNQTAGTAVSTKGVFPTPRCIQDVVSAMYYARNINFDRYKPGDKIPFDMYLDDEVYHLYIRYIGKETVKTRYGKFRAIKFKPLLIKGTMFQGGEKMTVWVSDDPNHLVLRVESPISVGSVKVDMYGYKNLRYPLSSLLSVRGK